MSREPWNFEGAVVEALDDIHVTLREIAATLARIADALQPIELSAVLDPPPENETPT